MQQFNLLSGLHDCQLAVEDLKRLRPIFKLMLDQFPEDWKEEWIDQVYWLIDRCSSTVDYSIDLMDATIDRAVEALESGHLQQLPPATVPRRSPGAASGSTPIQTFQELGND